MDRRFLAILAAIVLIFIGGVALSKNSKNTNSSSNSSGQATNHVQGQGTKGVTLVEYGDYECPICGAYYQPLKQVYTQFSNDIYFQFRNLPLTSIHPNAFAAARAAEAAGLQNKYWEMHDMLYQNQNDWASSSTPQTTFESYAKALGLDATKFKADYASSKVNDAINADLNAFSKTGQQMATPTFFLDGKYIKNTDLSDPQTGQPSPEKFAQVINAEIAAKQKNQ